MTTTYPSPVAPAAPKSDPTAVLGRRIAAFVLDALVMLALLTGLAMALWEHSEIVDGFDDGDAYCDALVDSTDFDGQCVAFPADAPVLGDYVYLVDTSDQIIQSVAPIAWIILNFIVLQGLTGATVGKLITGVRVVRGSGQRAGMGPCAGRTVLWIVDAAPWIFPLVGLITALTTNGHRRVGDMAASTYVVGRSSVGTPISTAAALPPPDQTAWGAPPADLGAWGAPPAPDPAAAPGPAEPAAEPADDPAPPVVETATAAGSTAGETPEPHWDDARNAYLQWDPNESAWLQWDDVAGRWKPIDS